jgi:hypothetical protein
LYASIFSSRRSLIQSPGELQMIRFLHGVPQSIFFSQHADGVAYSYASVEKQGIRPVNYVASGSHANYPIVGSVPLHTFHSLY